MTISAKANSTAWSMAWVILVGSAVHALAGCGVSPAPTLDLVPVVPGEGDTPTNGDGIDEPAPPGDGTEEPQLPDWDPVSAQYEDEVLALVNQRRAEGADCGGAGTFGPTHALTMNALLRTAARNHSLDMATRDFFDHFNPDGDGPGERIAATGYVARAWGENIAWGQRTPEQVVASWMDSDGHCANIMRSGFTEIGVGRHTENYWTQVFAAPAAD